MGKVRLECPNCGKAIAVSDTAKKARCPGCKEVIDLTEPADKPEAESAEVEQEAAAEEQPAEAPAGDGESDEEGDSEEGAEEDEDLTTESKRKKKLRKSSSSRRVARAVSASQASGSTALMIAAGAALVVLVALLILAEWPVAVCVTSMVLLFVDATLARVTRLTPGGNGSSFSPLLWAMLGLFPITPVVYFILRGRLVAASGEDIAEADMSAEDAEDAGKVSAPSLASPGMVLVVAITIGLAVFFPRGASVQLHFGVPLSKSNPKASAAKFTKSGTAKFDQGVTFAVMLSFSQVPEELTEVVCNVYHLSGDSPEESVTTENVPIPEEGKKAFWLLKLDEPGNYRVTVTDSNDGHIATETVRLRAIR